MDNLFKIQQQSHVEHSHFSHGQTVEAQFMHWQLVQSQLVH